MPFLREVFRLLCLLALAWLALDAVAAPAHRAPVVAIIQSAKWSPADEVREGAIEMEVFLCVARLKKQQALGGIVGVAGRNGRFLPSAENALAHVARMGVPIVRVGRSREIVGDRIDGLFVEAGALSAEDAERVLADCLARHGAPPAAVDPSRPTKKELAAIRAKLAVYQLMFNAHGATRVAQR